MHNTSVGEIKGIVAAQKRFFISGATLNIAFRKQMLKKLLAALEAWEDRLAQALWCDMHKSYEEAWLTEFSIVKSEIKCHLKNVSKWADREKLPSPVTIFPSRSYVVKEPLGTALIISPWNYPVQLLLNPLVGAISAGCTAVLKPSPYVPTVSAALAQMILETFPPDYVAVVQGHRDVNSALLEERWDLIFFTGSPALGKTVMAAAAKHLTPVVLELGGKSPCIVDKTADINIAARRIAWGKTLNSGQTCIAPDYLLVHKDVKEAFITAFSQQIDQLHGPDIFKSPHYVHMVNQGAFDRVSSYIKDADILYGGRTDEQSLCIEPTILDCGTVDNPKAGLPVMQQEIFGPVFPMIVVDGDSQESFVGKVEEFITKREKPLALYYFGDEKAGWDIVRKTSSGGGCINDVIMHIANGNAPFGGVGNSGMGRYHHRYSFECFSHRRTIIVSPARFDLPFRYMPYRLFKWVKKLI